MSLIDTNTMLTMMGVIPSPKTTARYNLLRQAAEAAVKSYCKWPIEQCQNVTDYYSGTGWTDIIVRRPFVSSIANLWFDPNGAFGQSTNAFASNTLLTQGGDYVLVLDDGDGMGKSGLIRRLTVNNYFWPGDYPYYQGVGGLAYQPPSWWQVGYGNIKVQYTFGFPSNLQLSSATWSSGVTTYTTTVPHGLAVGWSITVYGTGGAFNGEYTVLTTPTTTTFTTSINVDPGISAVAGTVNAIPPDIQAAVVSAAGTMANSTKYGFPLSSESLGAHSYSTSIQKDVAFGEVRQLLSRWRDLAI